jgi:hypothetical protein
MSRTHARCLALSVVMASAAGLASLAGGEAAMDRFRALVQEKRALGREADLLKLEAEAAATKQAYVLFDPRSGTLEFRVRGRAFKSYTFSTIAHDSRGRFPADPESVYRAVGARLTVAEKEGGHPELVPPTPTDGEEEPLFSDPNQLIAQTGALTGPTPTDAGVLGVDAPSEYFIRFDENVLFHIRSTRSRTFREKAADQLSEIAENIRATWTGIFGPPRDIKTEGGPRVEIYLTTDVETAKNLHYSLLPGERFFLVPPPEPSIVLVEARSAPAAKQATR